MASAWKGGHTFSMESITTERMVDSSWSLLFTFALSKAAKAGRSFSSETGAHHSQRSSTFLVHFLLLPWDKVPRQPPDPSVGVTISLAEPGDWEPEESTNSSPLRASAAAQGHTFLCPHWNGPPRMGRLACYGGAGAVSTQRHPKPGRSASSSWCLVTL